MSNAYAGSPALPRFFVGALLAAPGISSWRRRFGSDARVPAPLLTLPLDVSAFNVAPGPRLSGYTCLGPAVFPYISPASCCSFEIRARQSRLFPDPFTSFASLIRRGTACCARHQFLATTLRIRRSRSRHPLDFAFRGFRFQFSAASFSPACPERSRRASCSAVWPL
jgi:hypothetical protein